MNASLLPVNDKQKYNARENLTKVRCYCTLWSPLSVTGLTWFSKTKWINVIFLSISTSLKWSLSFRFVLRNSVHITQILQCVSCITHSIIYPHNNELKLRIIKLFTGLCCAYAIFFHSTWELLYMWAKHCCLYMGQIIFSYTQNPYSGKWTFFT